MVRRESMRVRGERNMGDTVSLPVRKKKQSLAAAHKVKEEAVEPLYTSEEEDQMSIAQYFLSGPKNKTPIHFSPPEVKEEMPLETKKRPRGPKFETERVVPDTTRKTDGCKRQRSSIDEPYDHFEVQSSAVMERAEEVQANLAPEFPSFIKLMLRSHVTKGFWLGLPLEFCKLHMLRHDETVVLEGENGVEYKTNFLVDKVGLSGGWRGFSVAHKLLEGDVVVFHLVHPSKFKVYIVRANALAEVDGALGLLNLDLCADETDFERDLRRCKSANEKHLRPPTPDILRENIQKNSTVVLNSTFGPATDQPENGGEDISSEDTEHLGLSGFVGDFENFNIIVNGAIIDSELSKHLRAKYYELCFTQKSYLHRHLLKSLNSTLVAGIISETINIADAIRACKLSTSQDDFAIWGKTLEAFELLGMDVGFLRARLNRLVSLVFESTEAAESKRYMEARLELDYAEEEMRTLELKLLELRQTRIRLDEEMEALKVNSQRYERMFQEELNAPW